MISDVSAITAYDRNGNKLKKPKYDENGKRIHRHHKYDADGNKVHRKRRDADDDEVSEFNASMISDISDVSALFGKDGQRRGGYQPRYDANGNKIERHQSAKVLVDKKVEDNKEAKIAPKDIKKDTKAEKKQLKEDKKKEKEEKKRKEAEAKAEAKRLA